MTNSTDTPFLAPSTPEQEAFVVAIDEQPDLAASQELSLVQRKALALTSFDAASSILEREVNVAVLARMAESVDQRTRLTGKRALRAIEAATRPDSKVIKAIGEQGIYPFMEGVILYGADTAKFLALLREEDEGLTPETVTGLYALRESIAQHSEDGKMPSFPSIKRALQRLGISLADGGADPDMIAELIDQTGMLEKTASSGRGGTPAFIAHSYGNEPLVEDDPDGSFSEAILKGQRAQLSSFADETEYEADSHELGQIMRNLEELVNGK
ncbi:MAG TPA: hypothetical protein VG604_03100 [Candidatus Saccharimonadales bacterium]|nr:hypothetical protein [Candidatus Saccharimonadales bacterium]